MDLGEDARAIRARGRSARYVEVTVSRGRDRGRARFMRICTDERSGRIQELMRMEALFHLWVDY